MLPARFYLALGDLCRTRKQKVTGKSEIAPRIGREPSQPRKVATHQARKTRAERLCRIKEHELEHTAPHKVTLIDTLSLVYNPTQRNTLVRRVCTQTRIWP